MKAGKLAIGILFCASLGISAASYSEDNGGVAGAFSSGKAYASLRFRYEFVDQDGFDKDANAFTVRSRLGYKTGDFNDFNILVEFEDVHPLGTEKFNSSTNGKTQYPAVVDPKGTEVNQALLSYTGLADTVIQGGRFRLVLDNVRFIGDVGWRQNNQTFDGAALINSSIENLQFIYGYVGNVNRIQGHEHPLGDIHTNAHIVHLAYTGCEHMKAAGFAYLLDLEDAVESLSSATYGARLNGDYGFSDDLSFLYDLSYAYQTDYGDNPLDFSTNYYFVQPGIKYGGFVLKATYELLGSDNGAIGFFTPLATLHAWNGWADKFLSTPADGLQDIYVSLNYKFEDMGLKLAVIYHDFSSDEGSTDYGTEWDAALIKDLGKDYFVSLHYMDYNADNFAEDTTKVVFTFSAKFKQS
ncbi:MAG: hypothetical protein D6808_06540 [Candidatus Dadabacteria bacterium]|nr:MAG: hypothetical protein D6808_06540 [Candidatus Dadabacteria bacterium]